MTFLFLVEKYFNELRYLNIAFTVSYESKPPTKQSLADLSSVYSGF